MEAIVVVAVEKSCTGEIRKGSCSSKLSGKNSGPALVELWEKISGARQLIRQIRNPSQHPVSLVALEAGKGQRRLGARS